MEYSAEKVLVVADQADRRKSVAELLKRNFVVDVIEVVDAIGAIEFLKRDTVVIVLADSQTPGRDASDLFSYIEEKSDIKPFFIQLTEHNMLVAMNPKITVVSKLNFEELISVVAALRVLEAR